MTLLRTETRKIDSLRPDPNNPRSIDRRAMAALKASVKRFGLVQPIVVNESTGHVVGGHQRLEALRQLGETDVAVVVGSWSKAEERALNVTLNNPATQGVFTDAAGYLDEVMSGLTLEDFRSLQLDAVMPTPSKAPTASPRDNLVYRIVITCTDERHQAELLERFDADGLDAAPLVS